MVEHETSSSTLVAVTFLFDHECCSALHLVLARFDPGRCRPLLVVITFLCANPSDCECRLSLHPTNARVTLGDVSATTSSQSSFATNTFGPTFSGRRQRADNRPAKPPVDTTNTNE